MKKLIIFSTFILAIGLYLGSHLMASTPTRVLVVDNLPANPYCGKSRQDFAAPIPNPCPPNQARKLNCARDCANTYADDMVGLSNTFCDIYQDKVDEYNTLIDHYGEELQHCLADAMGDDELEEQCWQNNNNTSLIAFNEYMVYLDAINFVYDELAAGKRDAYRDCMDDCCKPIIVEPEEH